MAELISAGEFATEGERRAAEHLKHLPDRWVVICNKTLPTNDGRSYEIDFIILASRWVFVLDEKSWRGRITGSDQEWVRADGTSERSPLNKIEAVARVMAGHLRAHVAALRQGHRQGHFVYGGVLLSCADRLPSLRDPRASDHVFLFDRVLEQLRTIDNDRQGGNAKVGTERDSIKKTLVDLANRLVVPQRIGTYQIEEVADQRPGVRKLRATTEQGNPRVLMMYDLGTDTTSTDSPSDFYKREFEALNSLHATNLVPRVHDPFPWSDGFFILPIEPPAGELLSMRALPETRDDLVLELRIAEACFKGLGTIHDAGIIHRALRPDAISIEKGKSVRVQFSNFFAARNEASERSIALTLDLLAIEDPYASPLLAGSYGEATRETDLWSLALIVLVRLTRTKVQTARAALLQRGEFPGLKRTWASLPADIVSELDTLLQNVLHLDFSQPRPSAAEIASQFGALARRLKAESHDIGEQVFDKRYRVHQLLGQGAMARTYLATDTQTDVIVAVKQFDNLAVIYDQVKAEYKALQAMHSKYLPNILHVQEPEKDAHVIMEYVPGVTLDELSTEFPWPIERWWGLARDLLAALADLEQRNLLHRDIKPANIIIHEQGGHAVLIDFGFAVGIGQPQQAAGTPLYLPPEALTASTPPPGTDRYAAAVVLYRVLTGHLPFNLDTPGQRTLRKPDTDDHQRDHLCSALLCALDPDPAKRYSSAQEMRNAMQQALRTSPQPAITDTTERTKQVNPWVDNVRGLYRNSGQGNADNRGLDSEFVRTTYVDTALDTHLLPAILAHRPKAVFLSGNPGDGKTAFLAQVQAVLAQRGGELVQDDCSGWEMRLAGHTFRSCYDASESHEGTSADAQLTARLRNLEGTDTPDAPLTVMVAINDGRLADYFTRQRDTFGWLAQQIAQARQSTALDQMPVWVIDLKQRAFVHLPGEEQPQDSVMQRVLERLIAAEHWDICARCTAQQVCPMQQNAAALRSPDVRTRLEHLLLLTHLRQQRHTTMRDLRSVLAYLITSNTGCEEVHQLHRSEAVENLLRRSYWNAAFQPLDRGDDLLVDMTALDPARLAHPRLDRFLYFHQRNSDAALCSRMFSDGQDLARLHFTSEQEWMDAMKRRLYFEAAPPPAEHSSADPFPRIGWQTLLPYQHADTFLAALQQQDDHPRLLQTIAQGILQSDGVTGQQTDGYLTTTVTSSATQQLVILKQLPLAEFRLRVVYAAHSAGIDSIPELLVLEHASGTPRLELNLDLFELLMRMAAGLLPEAPEFRPLLEDLAPFKNALLLQTTRDLVLIESQYRTHFITQRNGTIIRKKDREVQA